MKYLSDLLDAFGVSFLEKYFEKEIDSQIIKYNLEFDTMVVLKMNLIRAILKQPKLLILIDSHGLTNRSKMMTTQILQKIAVSTLIISIQ